MTPPPDESVPAGSPDLASSIDDALRDGAPDRIIELFEGGQLAANASAALGARAAESLIKLNRTDDALRVLAAVTERFPDELRPRQLQALALARRGSTADISSAQEILAGLYARGERDPETLGIYARTWKIMFSRSRDKEDLRRARDLYVEAHRAVPTDHYSAINAASTSLLLGTAADKERGCEYAEQTHAVLGNTVRPGDFWGTASVAEAWLVKEDYARAAQLYAAATAMAPTEIGSHTAMWEQVCRLLQVLQPSSANRALIREPFRHLADCDDQRV